MAGTFKSSVSFYNPKQYKCMLPNLQTGQGDLTLLPLPCIGMVKVFQNKLFQNISQIF